jgi:hypothetical protein
MQMEWIKILIIGTQKLGLPRWLFTSVLSLRYYTIYKKLIFPVSYADKFYLIDTNLPDCVFDYASTYYFLMVYR